ncbi:MAG TPA: protoporphyrinogen oxidase [Lapillicoccus sp.]|nr:protoporphyrinogen oxidase [Lapillicoccus sp.]
MPTSTVAVVGAGISGLAAAWELLQHNTTRVIVLDASTVPGGKLRLAEVAGHPIDVGAESMLARRPEATALVAELGLEAALTHPNPVPAAVWSRGRRWPLPSGTVMGVPTDPPTAAGLLSPDEVARAAAEQVGPPVTEDLSVGEFVADRVGPAVVDRLVEPLLAGVYAGHARRLSLQATVPALWAAATTGTGLVGQAIGGNGGGPVFAGYRGGLGRLAADLAAALVSRGVEIRSSTTVRALDRRPGGWRLTAGPTTAEQGIDVDGVVLAVPAAPAARLLRPTAPAAADQLAAIEYASVGIVTFALPRDAADLLQGSGVLVPPVEPLTIKATTFSSTKWAWLDADAAGVVLARASLGRAGEAATLQRDDADLVATALADLRTILGPDLPDPVDTHLQRWGGALPQYAVGHVDRVAAVLAATAALPALGLAGAAYEGVGIPACIGSGRRAAREVVADLRQRQ